MGIDFILAYQSLALDVMSLGTAITEIVLREKMEDLYQRYKFQFDLMAKAGQLVKQLDITSDLSNNIQKAQIMSVRNWDTIFIQLQRNSEFIQQLSKSAQKRKKFAQQSKNLRDNTFRNILNYVGVVTNLGFSAHLLHIQYEKYKVGKLQEKAQKEGVLLKQSTDKMKIYEINGKRVQIKQVKPSRLKKAGTYALRGMQIVGNVLSMVNFVMQLISFDQMFKQMHKMEQYYSGENKDESLSKDLYCIGEALLYTIQNLSNLFWATRVVIQDFNRVFSLQYALTIEHSQAFSTLAVRYDPQKLGFQQKKCGDLTQIFQQLNQKFTRDQQSSQKMIKVNSKQLQMVTDKFQQILQKFKPKQLLTNFTVTLSRDLSGSIMHKQIWEDHNRKMDFHRQTQRSILRYLDQHEDQSQYQAQAIQKGKEIYDLLQKNSDQEKVKDYLDLLQKKNLFQKDRKKKIQLRSQLQVNEIEQGNLQVYLRKNNEKQKTIQDQLKLLKKIEQYYRSYYLSPFKIEESLSVKDKTIIITQIIAHFQKFYATDKENGEHIYGFNIKEFIKQKEQVFDKYEQKFKRISTDSNIIPISNKKEQNQQSKQFKQHFAKYASKIDSYTIDMHFIRLFDKIKDGSKILHSSVGWRLKIAFKDKPDDIKIYYLQKDRSQPQWQFIEEKEIFEKKETSQEETKNIQSTSVMQQETKKDLKI